MSIKTNVPRIKDVSLYQILRLIIRRAIDGTRQPLFVDEENLRIGIRTIAPATSAALEIAGTTGAVLFPRMTTTQRDALTAVDGMVIYNTSNTRLEARENGAWVDL